MAVQQIRLMSPRVAVAVVNGSAPDNWVATVDLSTLLTVATSATAGLAAPQLFNPATDPTRADTAIIFRSDGYGQLFATTTALMAYDKTNRTTAPLLFLWAGQSNSMGEGLLADLPGGYPASPARTALFGNDYRFHCPATDPIDSSALQQDSVSNDGATPGVSAGIPMIDRITDPANGNRINQCHLIPCPRAATAILAWQPGTNHFDRATLYGSMSTRARWVMDVLGATLNGLVWYQGEQDALNSVLPTTYQASAQAMFDALRIDLAQPNLPIWIVRLPATVPTGFASGDWAALRTAQAALAGSLQFIINAPDGPFTDGTNQHLSTAAQITLGHALADSYLARY